MKVWTAATLWVDGGTQRSAGSQRSAVRGRFTVLCSPFSALDMTNITDENRLTRH
jgi:hypothetical protein